MIDGKNFNKILGIRESFEMPDVLLKKILDKEEKKNLLAELEKNNFLNTDTNDILRDYFQEQHSNRSDLKQDYTPDCICKIIEKLQPKADSILDVCSGTGSLILNNSKNKFIVCEELSKRSIPVLLLNLVVKNAEGYVVEKNVITNSIEKMYRLISNEKYSEVEEIKPIEIKKEYDVIVSNPPYSVSWEPKYDERFDGYELPPKDKSDYVFVLDVLYRLSNKGRGILILPNGVLFRRTKRKRNKKKTNKK